MSGFLLAGTHSGCGKTLVSLALMAYLRQQGLKVQPFKVGPDFIDPGHHQAICGKASHNLDGWMLSRSSNLEIFRRYGGSADVCVVEGVMGLFDGFSPVQESGSSAQMAKWLGLPVFLVLDARSMARSVAAVVQGFANFDLDLDLAGVICNRVGSQGHADLLRQSLEHYQLPPAVAFLPSESGLELPSRHLGLVTAQDRGWAAEELQTLAVWLQEGLREELFYPILDSRQKPVSVPEQARRPARDGIKTKKQASRVRMGVARDQAFCFYYQENLRLLEQAGAELVFFSPLQDISLPQGLQGIYLGGGYPELWARELAANMQMRSQILDFACQDNVIYAECGGFMYLMQSITDLEGREHPMAGFFRLQAQMCERFQALGYREVTLQQDCSLGCKGSVLKGHEFHYSKIWQSQEACASIYAVQDRKGKAKSKAGWNKQNVLGSYIHLHFASLAQAAENLVSACALGQGAI
ncbi:MAG: cobyrinate a,c-diamide synthase [Thermodesulfobacteriota bacterium]